MIKFDKNFRNATPSEIVDNYPDSFKKDIYLCFKSLLNDELCIRDYRAKTRAANLSTDFLEQYYLMFGNECSCFCENSQKLYQGIRTNNLNEAFNKLENSNNAVKKHVLNDDIWGLCNECKCSEYLKFVNGDPLNNIRNYHDIILNEEFANNREVIDDVFVNYMERKDVNDIPKYNLKFTIGGACNYACKSCRPQHNTEDFILPDNDVIEVLRFLNKYQSLTIGCWGEFFFKNNYMQIFKHKVNAKKITLFSNGSIFNETNWMRLHPYNQNNISNIIISIDAATEETYKNVRGPLWNQLMNNLEFLHELKKDKQFELTTNFTISKLNMHEVIPFVDKFHDKFDKIFFNYAWSEFGESHFNDAITDLKLRNEITDTIHDLQKQYPAKINL